MENPYQPIEAVIERVVEETPTIKTFLISPRNEVSFSTGQFVEVTLPGVGEAPFTPSSDPSLKGKMEVTVMNVGRVTNSLHQLKEKDRLGIRGPYGRGYPLNEFENKELLIVGGGVGLAPLRSLVLTLLKTPKKYKRILLRYGARTPKDLLYKQELKLWQENKDLDVVITVDKADKAWRGNVGVVTTILDNLKINLKDAISVVCGPPIMMKFVTFKLLDLGFSPKNIYLSMEKNMSCGMGMCGHCRIGNYYVCRDGPVFSYEQIKEAHELWD